MINIYKSVSALLAINFMLINVGFAAEVPQTFTYQGRLLNQQGSGPILDQVSLTLSIYSADGSCLLYKEKQSLDLSQTDGAFSVQVGSNVGSPKRASEDPGMSMAQIFANSGSIAQSGSCLNGFTPSANESRKLKVSVSVHGGASSDLSPDLTLASVPTSLVAETLQGLKPSDLIQKSSNITQNNLEKMTNGSDSSDLHNHDSLYVKLGSDISANKVTISGTPQSNTDAVSLGVVNSKLAAKQDALGYTPVNKAGDTMVGPLNLSANPSQDSEASNKAYVDAQRDQAISTAQANTSSAIAGKADQSSVNSALALKADQSSVTSALSLKADQSSVTSSLSLKADQSSVTSSLSLKADKTDLSSKENVLTFSSPVLRAGNVISVQSASSSQPGVLSASDYAAFNSKLDSTLSQGNIFVGNSSGKAVAVSMSGDATINQSGVVTLKNTGTAGTFTKVTTDAQGRITSGSALLSSDVTSSLGYSPLNKGGDSMTGTLVGKPAINVSTSTVDFSQGNFQYTAASCGAFQLNNVKDGGSYNFVVKGTTSATCSFTAFSDAGTTSLTVHMPPDHSATTVSKQTFYTFMVLGADVYVSWMSGF